ncbi:MAG: VWA domain-containing protein [Actinomycetota bacterium]|nr:VWA domain-containing protein [Actinomycetota bacterium]
MAANRDPGYRYGPWRGGRDPLEPPYDVATALDALGDEVLAGSSPAEALRGLLRRGSDGLRGLDDLRHDARKRRREARRRGRLDGTLDEVRALLDRALAEERTALFPDPSDGARLAEAELDALPPDTAGAVRQLAEYPWRSEAARQTYEEIRDLLRREILDSQFRGLKQALENTDPAQMQRVKDMLADLNAMLAADARGESTQAQFEKFMERHGDFFPGRPSTLEDLVDELARRAAASQRLLDSLSAEQRGELGELMSAAMADIGLASEMDQLRQNLRAARPDLPWQGRQRIDGEENLGLGDATTALQELADLDELDTSLAQDYPGASLLDVDDEQVERALGRQAVDDLAALRRIERELARQGYLTRRGEDYTLTPRAVRRLGATALRRVFSRFDSPGRGSHDVRDAGAAGDLIGSSRPWMFGDEQPLDITRTVRNAVLRSARAGARPPGRAVPLAVEDFEVVETERRTSAVVALLVDLSYSMALRGTWGAAKSTALALHTLVTTRYPQDRIEIIGFSDYARILEPTALAGLSSDMVQGTNLQHGLMLANRHLQRHPDAEPVVLVVTDGEPTAHLARSGRAVFCWPPLPETIELTLAEVERCTRRGATINVFMLDDEPRLVEFVDEIARRNGGRVFAPAPDRLGEYVVSDYLRARRGRRTAG